jgi:lysophospholipase L1-like esterase
MNHISSFFSANFLLSTLFSVLLLTANASSQDSSSQDLLQDKNGDELIVVDGFGDSITFGTGDGNLPGEFVETSGGTDGNNGYLRRIRELAGVLTINSGLPGENFVASGVNRLPGVLSSSSGDILALMEGVNDAGIQVSSDDYRTAYQQAINVIIALGKTPLLLTLPPPCCDRAGQAPFTRAYSRIIRELALLNSAVLADIERAWDSTCVNRSQCELFNVPEGLHPNSRGYTVIGQTVTASLFGVNIFAQDGAALLEERLALEPGTIIVRPDEVTIQE